MNVNRYTLPTVWTSFCHINLLICPEYLWNRVVAIWWPNMSSLATRQELRWARMRFMSSYSDGQVCYHWLLLLFNQLWPSTGIRGIPRCWNSLQSILCTYFFPKCDSDSKKIFMPDINSMCDKLSKGPCRLIQDHLAFFCPETNRSSSSRSTITNSLQPQSKADNCSSPSIMYQYKDLKINTSVAKCLPPLVPSEDQNLWFPGIEGCAFNCSDPRFSDGQKSNLRSFIIYGSLVSFLLCFLASVTYMMEWKANNQYPYAVVFFYLSFSSGMALMAFLLQFIWWRKEDIVCQVSDYNNHMIGPKGSFYPMVIRSGEPITHLDHKCVTSFLISYYFSMASLIWFSIMCHSYNDYLRKRPEKRPVANQKTPNRPKNFGKTYHMVAWTPPLILSMIIFWSNKIDGSYLTGICMVGLNDWVFRIFFMIIPVVLTIFVSEYFSFRSLKILYQMHSFAVINYRKTVETGTGRNESQAMLHSNKDSKKRMAKHQNDLNKLKTVIIKFLVLMAFGLVSLSVVIFSNVFEYNHSNDWNIRVETSVKCSLNMSSLPLLKLINTSGDGLLTVSDVSQETNDCRNQTEVPLIHVYLQLMMIFLSGVMASGWIWTSSTTAIWRRHILRLCNAEEQIKLEDQKAIQQRLVGANGETNPRMLQVLPKNVHLRHGDPVCLNLTDTTDMINQQIVKNHVKGSTNDTTNIRSISSLARDIWSKGFKKSSSNTSLNDSQTANQSHMSVEEMHQLRNQERIRRRSVKHKERRRQKEQINKAVSETSSIHSHFLWNHMNATSGPAANGVTRSTSMSGNNVRVGSPYPAPYPFMFNNGYMPNPFMPPGIGFPSPFGIQRFPVPQVPPLIPLPQELQQTRSVRPIIRHSLRRLKAEHGTNDGNSVNLSFTHGMINNTGTDEKLIQNPLECDLRRPGTAMNYHQPMLNMSAILAPTPNIPMGHPIMPLNYSPAAAANMPFITPGMIVNPAIFDPFHGMDSTLTLDELRELERLRIKHAALMHRQDSRASSLRTDHLVWNTDSDTDLDNQREDDSHRETFAHREMSDPLMAKQVVEGRIRKIENTANGFMASNGLHSNGNDHDSTEDSYDAKHNLKT